MVELTGTLKGASFSYETGLPLLTFEMDQKSAALEAVQRLSKEDRLTIKVDKYRKKRSENALSYLWVLCGLIADKLSDDGVPHTKDEIYREAIRARGVYREQGELPLDFAKTVMAAWSLLGVGWLTEQVDFEPDGDRVRIRLYYGCSTYNTKQMSRLIDWLVVECMQLGIETKSQEEIDSLLNSWRAAKC